MGQFLCSCEPAWKRCCVIVQASEAPAEEDDVNDDDWVAVFIEMTPHGETRVADSELWREGRSIEID